VPGLGEAVAATTAGAADGEAAGEASAGRAGLGAGLTPDAAEDGVEVGAAALPPHADSQRLMAAHRLSRPTWSELRFRRTLASPDVNVAQYIHASNSTGTLGVTPVMALRQLAVSR
jgi:hypothetical protein